jgi:hypothetical protein
MTSEACPLIDWSMCLVAGLIRRMSSRWLSVSLIAFFVRTVAGAAPVPLINAHAHNDYEHRRPLFDALNHGFCSVEADIFYTNGQFLVAHNIEDVRPERTLQKLYLDPLRKLMKEHDGKIYGNEPRFFLLIDFKSDFRKTYPALNALLSTYSDLLTQWKIENGKWKMNSKAVTVVLTGNTPVFGLDGEKTRFAGVDGKIQDLAAATTNDCILWISDNWKNFSKWNGRGEIPEKDRAFVQSAAQRAHAKGKLIRFWNAPDTKGAWREFQQDGIDLLNADNLAGLEKFLLANPASGALLDAPVQGESVQRSR